MHAHMPAIEIAFGDTFREASQVVADCAHFLFRVAIGRRSIAFADDSFIVDAIHSRTENRSPENNSEDRRAVIAKQMRSLLAQRAFLRDDAETCL